MGSFFKTTLRTTDVEAARTFYASVLGGGALDVVHLHEEAIARGARPHWLGFLDVDDVDRAVTTFREGGATQLGLPWVNAEGLAAAMMRDPGGAVVALAKPPPKRGAPQPAGPATADAVAWHVLNTPDVERAKATYGALFGWAFAPPSDLGPLGVYHPFAWQAGGPPVGSMTDIRARPQVHPHWLFHFRVVDVGAATEAVRSAGGTVVAEVSLPTGERITVCDDPQGAAFAVRQEAARP